MLVPIPSLTTRDSLLCIALTNCMKLNYYYYEPSNSESVEYGQCGDCTHELRTEIIGHILMVMVANHWWLSQLIIWHWNIVFHFRFRVRVLPCTLRLAKYLHEVASLKNPSRPLAHCHHLTTALSLSLSLFSSIILHLSMLFFLELFMCAFANNANDSGKYYTLEFLLFPRIYNLQNLASLSQTLILRSHKIQRHNSWVLWHNVLRYFHSEVLC